MDKIVLMAEMMAPLQSKVARVLLLLLVGEAVKNKRCVVALKATSVALGMKVSKQAVSQAAAQLEALQVAVRNPWRPGTWILNPSILFDTSTRHGARQLRIFYEVIPKMREGMALMLKGKLPPRMDKLVDEATGF